MTQEIIVGIIIGVCLAAAVAALVRRFRGKRPACNCDDCPGCNKN